MYVWQLLSEMVVSCLQIIASPQPKGFPPSSSRPNVSGDLCGGGHTRGNHLYPKELLDLMTDTLIFNNSNIQCFNSSAPTSALGSFVLCPPP